MLPRTGAAAGCKRMKHGSSELKTRSIFRNKATKSQEPGITHSAVTTLCVLKAHILSKKGLLCIPNPYYKKKKTFVHLKYNSRMKAFL